MSPQTKKFRTPVRLNLAVVKELEEILLNDGRTIDEICRKAGVYQHSWQHWRAGKHSPRLDLFDSLAQVLGYRIKIEKIQEETADEI